LDYVGRELYVGPEDGILQMVLRIAADQIEGIILGLSPIGGDLEYGKEKIHNIECAIGSLHHQILLPVVYDLPQQGSIGQDAAIEEYPQIDSSCGIVLGLYKEGVGIAENGDDGPWEGEIE
jgi:hypothetical protein